MFIFVMFIFACLFLHVYFWMFIFAGLFLPVYFCMFIFASLLFVSLVRVHGQFLHVYFMSINSGIITT